MPSNKPFMGAVRPVKSLPPWKRGGSSTTATGASSTSRCATPSTLRRWALRPRWAAWATPPIKALGGKLYDNALAESIIGLYKTGKRLEKYVVP